MELNITGFSALDEQGTEHVIADFKGNGAIPIRGLHKGEFLKSKSILRLAPGTYTTLRFYLGKTGNSFIFSDGRKEVVREFQYLDFEVVNGLRIRGDEAPEVILRFDFVPFSKRRTLWPFGQLFKGSRGFGAKLANSMDH